MKKLRLLAGFYRNNWISCLVLTAILTFALFQMAGFLGTLRYMHYAKDFWQSSHVENSLYYMPTAFESEDPRSGAAKLDLEAQNFPAVESVLCLRYTTGKLLGKYINVVICDDAYLSTFRPVDVGRWLDEDGTADTDAVVCGYLFDDVSLGETVTMDFGWEEPKPVTFTVTGKKLEPAYLPSLGAASANVSAIDLLEQGHNMLLLRESSLTQGLVEEGGYHQNCLVKLHADATSEQVAQVEEYLISRGSFITSEELLQNTDRAITAEMRRNLPLPLFLLVVSFVSLLSVSILLVQKTLPEHGVYRLCGCSRRESFSMLLLGIGLMGFVGGGLVMGYVVLCPWLAAQEWIVQENTILDARLLPWLASFTLICSGVPVLLCWLQMRKFTPVEHYRRELQ